MGDLSSLSESFKFRPPAHGVAKVIHVLIEHAEGRTIISCPGNFYFNGEHDPAKVVDVDNIVKVLIEGMCYIQGTPCEVFRLEDVPGLNPGWVVLTTRTMNEARERLLNDQRV